MNVHVPAKKKKCAHPRPAPRGHGKNEDNQQIGVLLDRQAPGVSDASHIVLDIE